MYFIVMNENEYYLHYQCLFTHTYHIQVMVDNMKTIMYEEAHWSNLTNLLQGVNFKKLVHFQILNEFYYQQNIMKQLLK